MISIEPLDGNFGVAIRGVNVAAGVDDDTLKTLTDALYENRVIVIKDQSCGKEDYLTFGRLWGKPIPHVLDHMRMPGYPDLLVVGNTEEKDRREEIRNGAALWHTDQSYEAVPASATMLYSINVPQQGGKTQICNMVAAYDGLSDAMKTRINGLKVAHRYGAGKLREGELVVNPLANNDQVNAVPTCYHPMVLAHPVTGRNALYAMGHGAHAIKGMPDDEAVDLIEQMRDHCLQEKYIYRHGYDVGDVAIWDTLSTMHCATPIEVATSGANARLLWRISVRGKPKIYADLAA